MKQKDVRIGETYYTRIGDRQEKVIVVDQITDTFSGRVRFRVRKIAGGSSVLPKSRASSALHPVEKAQEAPRSITSGPDAADMFAAD